MKKKQKIKTERTVNAQAGSPSAFGQAIAQVLKKKSFCLRVELP
jgi:hypothetical protein